MNPIRRGLVSELVAYANSLGVATITGKPYKPTTYGKNERLHSSLFKWLKKQPYVKDLDALQRQIDAFDHAYNHERGHQSLEDRMTPQQAWDANAAADPPEPGYALKYSTKPPSKAITEPIVDLVESVAEPVSAPANLMATLRSEDMGSRGEQLMRANKNRCIRIAGVEIYLGKLMRSTELRTRWDQQELMLISMTGQLIARYDFQFPEGTKYRSLKHATALFENPRDDQ